MRQAQVIKCKCGSIFAACVVPECYTQNDWIKDVKKYAKQGLDIDLMDCGAIFLSECVCVNDTPVPEDKSQLKMFI